MDVVFGKAGGAEARGEIGYIPGSFALDRGVEAHDIEPSAWLYSGAGRAKAGAGKAHAKKRRSGKQSSINSAPNHTAAMLGRLALAG